MHMTTEIYQINLVHKQHSSGKFKNFSGLDQPHLQMMFTKFICNIHNSPLILFSIQVFIGPHNTISQYGNGTGACYDRKDINSILQSEWQAGNDNQDNLIMHIDYLIFKKNSNCLHIKDGKSQLFACFSDTVYAQQDHHLDVLYPHNQNSRSVICRVQKLDWVKIMQQLGHAMYAHPHNRIEHKKISLVSK